MLSRRLRPRPTPRRHGVIGAALIFALTLAACGGGGGSPTPSPSPSPSPTPTPTPTPGPSCSLRARQDWAAAQIREFYLFPETLPASLDPAGFTSVDAYIDALTATARGQGRDRFFTFLTSIADENAFFSSGQTAAFGIRLQIDAAARRVFVSDAYEGAPALAAGIDRGAEIIAIGTSAAALRTVDAIIAAEGEAGVSAALGPSTAGTTRTIRITDGGGTRDLTVTKADFAIQPVSPRYGTQVLVDGAQRIGYVNLRTFISTAEAPLRSAFARFRSEGITRVIVDFRYNGGGLVSVAELMGDLLGGNRAASDVFSYTTFRPEKSAANETRLFQPQVQSIAAMRIAFIGTADTASASELVINAFTPYLRADSALIGANTFGKPVGQIARDRAECDDRLRVVAFATQNAARQGDYYNGLATTVGTTCRAADSLGVAMGSPGEASTAKALDFLSNRGCVPITATAAIGTQRTAAPTMTLLLPDRPTPAQREVPGTF